MCVLVIALPIQEEAQQDVCVDLVDRCVDVGDILGEPKQVGYDMLVEIVCWGAQDQRLGLNGPLCRERVRGMCPKARHPSVVSMCAKTCFCDRIDNAPVRPAKKWRDRGRLDTHRTVSCEPFAQ